jgi:ferritin-like metal-binding protein YciE
MAELDGVWAVERLSGALPPLVGCVKRIHGDRGTTEFSQLPGVPFEVHGRRLRYPTGLFVDVLERQDGGYLGRATFMGRELGRFTMRRLDDMEQLKDQLIKHLDEAHAMEQNVLRMLDGMIATTDDPEILDAIEHHKVQTQGHADRMAMRLEAHDAAPSAVRQLGGVLGALAKMPLDFVRGEKAGRNARDAYATEHLEIASYELLRRVAQKAGDEETATAALEIIDEERAMANLIEQHWDRFAELSLEEEGITV